MRFAPLLATAISLPARRPIPSFRRRPESRTPVYPEWQNGRVWIPAFAGMTVGAAMTMEMGRVGSRSSCDKLRMNGGGAALAISGELAAVGVSPSPNPLPLGEGFRLGAYMYEG